LQFQDNAARLVAVNIAELPEPGVSRLTVEQLQRLSQ